MAFCSDVIRYINVGLHGFVITVSSPFITHRRRNSGKKSFLPTHTDEVFLPAWVLNNAYLGVNFIYALIPL